MIRWYISPYAGAGSPLDPFHAACWDYTDKELNECTGSRCPQRRHYLVRVNSAQANHDAIIANNAGRPISPMFADAAEEQAALNAVFLHTVSKTNAEVDGYSTDWMTTHTFKDMIRYIVRQCHVSQRISRYTIADRLFQLGLSSTVADLTTAQRTAIREWMTGHNLSVAWITTATTIRQLIHYLMINLPHKPHTISGVEY